MGEIYFNMQRHELFDPTTSPGEATGVDLATLVGPAGAGKCIQLSLHGPLRSSYVRLTEEQAGLLAGNLTAPQRKAHKVKTEDEIKAEIARLDALRTAEVSKDLVGDPYLEHLHSALLIEKAARIRALNWVLGIEVGEVEREDHTH